MSSGVAYWAMGGVGMQGMGQPFWLKEQAIAVVGGHSVKNFRSVV